MALEPTGVSEQVIGSLKSCFVEGDPEQQRRERKIRRRALVVSVVLQAVVVAALVVFPLLGRSERISYEHVALPPYAPGSPVKQHTGTVKPHDGGRKFCIVCVDSRNPLRPAKPGEAVNTTLLQPEGDSIPGTPAGDGVHFGLNTDPRVPEKPRIESSVEPARRLKVTSLEPAMLTHRVEPAYPTLAKQTGREGRVELHAIIATDGSIQSLEVLSGDPLFYSSALAAVREWHYRPTVLNGQPVEIDTRITVVYKLNRY